MPQAAKQRERNEPCRYTCSSLLAAWKVWITGPSQTDANHQANDEDDQHDNDKRL